MEFNEKTKWAINILISHAVCCCKELYCEDDCPLYEDGKAIWSEEDIVNAVKWLNGRIKGEK
jgi:hypothetical protein